MKTTKTDDYGVLIDLGINVPIMKDNWITIFGRVENGFEKDIMVMKSTDYWVGGIKCKSTSSMMLNLGYTFSL